MSRVVCHGLSLAVVMGPGEQCLVAPRPTTRGGEWCSCVLIAGTSEPAPAHLETSSPGLTASGAMGPAVGGAIWLRWGSPRGPVVSEGRFGGAAWGTGLCSLAEEGPLLWYVGCKTRWVGEVHIYRKEGNTREQQPAWQPWLIIVVTLPWRKASAMQDKIAAVAAG